MKFTQVILVFLGLIIGIELGAIVRNLYEPYRLRGPRSHITTITKPGTADDYGSAEHPCPAYAKPTILSGPKGNEYGDCDGDGYVDEITAPPPSENVPWLYKRQWVFVLRPGVKKFYFHDKKPFAIGYGICISTSPCSANWQKVFEILKKSR